jgi:hypothetical protein
VKRWRRSLRRSRFASRGSCKRSRQRPVKSRNSFQGTNLAGCKLRDYFSVSYRLQYQNTECSFKP